MLVVHVAVHNLLWQISRCFETFNSHFIVLLYTYFQLETLCESYLGEKHQGKSKNSQKGSKEPTQNQDVVICKTEPPDSDEFGKTLKALNDNLTNDNELMSSLIENQNSVISEILAKLKDAPVAKGSRGRRKGTPRRKANTRTTQEQKNKTKRETTKKEEKKPPKKIKKEPIEYRDDIEDVNEIGNDLDLDDVDNDPDFEDDDDDDEDNDETYDPKEEISENPRGRKRRLSRNIRTGKVLRSAKKPRVNKPKEEKEPKERKKRKRGHRKGRVLAIDVLKIKLEGLNGEELADLGIRKIEPNELIGKAPAVMNPDESILYPE